MISIQYTCTGILGQVYDQYTVYWDRYMISIQYTGTGGRSVYRNINCNEFTNEDDI